MKIRFLLVLFLFSCGGDKKVPGKTPPITEDTNSVYKSKISEVIHDYDKTIDSLEIELMKVEDDNVNLKIELKTEINKHESVLLRAENLKKQLSRIAKTEEYSPEFGNKINEFFKGIDPKYSKDVLNNGGNLTSGNPEDGDLIAEQKIKKALQDSINMLAQNLADVRWRHDELLSDNDSLIETNDLLIGANDELINKSIADDDTLKKIRRELLAFKNNEAFLEKRMNSLKIQLARSEDFRVKKFYPHFEPKKGRSIKGSGGKFKAIKIKSITIKFVAEKQKELDDPEPYLYICFKAPGQRVLEEQKVLIDGKTFLVSCVMPMKESQNIFSRKFTPPNGFQKGEHTITIYSKSSAEPIDELMIKLY